MEIEDTIKWLQEKRDMLWKQHSELDRMAHLLFKLSYAIEEAITELEDLRDREVK